MPRFTRHNYRIILKVGTVWSIKKKMMKNHYKQNFFQKNQSQAKV